MTRTKQTNEHHLLDFLEYPSRHIVLPFYFYSHRRIYVPEIDPGILLIADRDESWAMQCKKVKVERK